MRWEKWIGIAATAWLLTSCAAQMDGDRYVYGTGGGGFTGTWQIDASQSDVSSNGWNGNRGWNDHGDRYNNNDQGRDNDRDDDRDRDATGHGWHAGVLPDAIRIDADHGTFRVTDGSGNIVESVAVNGYRDRDSDRGYQQGSYQNDQGMVMATGHWSGHRRLQIDPMAIGDRNVSQTLSLDTRDRLVVVTTVNGQRGTRTFTMVYDRTS